MSSEQTINWGAYATYYDLLCSHNDSYAELLQGFETFLRNTNLPDNPTIADIGAGTGNFTQLIAEVLPNAHIFHIDSNREMNVRALEKYQEKGFSNITMIETDVFSLDLIENSLDMLICINSLYALSPQQIALSKFRTWLKPDGLLYVVDLGREMNPLDWGLHFLNRARKENYIFQYLRDSIRGREVVKQNRTTRVAQRSGHYWMHETREFGEVLEASGYSIVRLEPCYRDYADLAICSNVAA